MRGSGPRVLNVQKGFGCPEPRGGGGQPGLGKTKHRRFSKGPHRLGSTAYSRRLVVLTCVPRGSFVRCVCVLLCAAVAAVCCVCGVCLGPRPTPHDPLPS